MYSFKIFSGTSVPGLGSSVARTLGVHLSSCTIEKFPDGETWVRLNEPVRGCDVFIIQSTSPPVNERLMELLAFADACRRAAAARIIAVIPYFGYARQDKRSGRREPITASMVADLLQAVGINQVITFDLHTPQVEGFFRIPVDRLTAVPILAGALGSRLQKVAVIVSPDAGRVKMATAYARELDLPVAVLHKQRESGSETKVTHLVGDVRDRPCVIIDDMISTGGTIAESIEALLEAGARPDITIAATHGVFVEGCREKLSPEAVREVLVTDTIQVTQPRWQQLKVVSVAPVLASAIRRFTTDALIYDLH
ncbi:MAG: ribose-phosphate pyrophosphokinase [Acidobacteriota bacterium]